MDVDVLSQVLLNRDTPCGILSAYTILTSHGSFPVALIRFDFSPHLWKPVSYVVFFLNFLELLTSEPCCWIYSIDYDVAVSVSNICFPAFSSFECSVRIPIECSERCCYGAFHVFFALMFLPGWIWGFDAAEKRCVLATVRNYWPPRFKTEGKIGCG